jgi:peptidyl-prolyl cis-trans isomerase SurA
LGYDNINSFEEKILNNKTYSPDEIKLKIKIELFWNDLIFNNYNDQIKIDEKKIINDYKNNKKEKTKEIFISEIVFRKIKNKKIENSIYEIKKSIEEIGFENTANLFSIAESAKYGGKIGWIETIGLPEKIYNNIINLEPNEYSDVININDNFIIYKVNDVRISKNNVDDNEEIQKLIENKKNQRLEQFSRIYFNKIKNQFLIYEK